MQNFQKIAITVAFSFTCFSVPVLGAAQSDLKGGAGEKASVEVKQPVVKVTVPVPAPGTIKETLGGAGVGASVQPGTPGTGSEEVGVGLDPDNGNGWVSGERVVPVPVKPDWTAGSLAEQVKTLQAQFKKEQQEVAKAYQDLLRKFKDSGKDEREKVREQFKVQREELLARQKELREEIKRRFEEFKAGHPEHLDVIDAAKERAKESVRERRGHVGG